jgi:hypothetical protein
MPATEVRLEAVPELGYAPSSQPPRGEVRLWRGARGRLAEPSMCWSCAMSHVLVMRREPSMCWSCICASACPGFRVARLEVRLAA